MVSFTQYGKSHAKVVEAGIDSIKSYYDSRDREEKRSLLLCLDRYLDPYYKYELPYADEIFEWLKTEFDNTHDMTIKEDIFELVENYSDLNIPGYELNDGGYFVKAK